MDYNEDTNDHDTEINKLLHDEMLKLFEIISCGLQLRCLMLLEHCKDAKQLRERMFPNKRLKNFPATMNAVISLKSNLLNFKCKIILLILKCSVFLNSNTVFFFFLHF